MATNGVMGKKPISDAKALVWLNALGYFAFVPFILYYLGAIFHETWVGDFHMYIAAVSSVYFDPFNPLHEAVNVDGKYSAAYTPMIVAAAVIGKLVGLSEYQALQLVGLTNIILYSASILIFFRVNSGARLPGLASGIFLAVSLFLREVNFIWSSETSYHTLKLIAAYPSLFAWGLALLTFACFERLMRTGALRYMVLIFTLLWLLILDHQITASWVIGILAVRVIAMWLLEPGLSTPNVFRNGVLLTILVLGSFTGALAWPYMSLLSQVSLAGVPEDPPFGQGLVVFTSMPWLYVAALVSAPLLWQKYEGRLLILYWFATASVFFLFKLIGLDYGMRYAFFMAFFAQVVVALVCAETISHLSRLSAAYIRVFPLRLAAGCFVLVITAVGLLQSQSLRFLAWELFRDFPKSSLVRQFDREGSADLFYNQYPELADVLSRDAVVLLDPSLDLAYDLRVLTGASSVVARFAFKVPDFSTRATDSLRFLEPDTPKSARLITIEQYGATHVLLTGSHIAITEELETQFGPPIVRSKALVLFQMPVMHPPSN